MTSPSDYGPLDDTDRAILQLLQRDARNSTAVEIAERIDVSDGTVRNRIEKLEELGVIEGYVPLINYPEAGYQLEIKIVCSVPIVEREQLAREALRIEGVVEAQELMTGRWNVLVKAVAREHDDLTRIAVRLDEMGANVEREELVRHHYFRPFNHFGTEDVSDDGEAVHVI